MIRISTKRKLPLWSIALRGLLGSLVATSLSTGMTAAAETKAASPKPGFLQSTLCKLCPKVPQNNTALDNCIRNCPEAVKKNMDALIAQIKEKEKLRSDKMTFIKGFDLNKAPINSKGKTQKRNAEKEKAKLESEINVLNDQIDKINHGLDRVRKALDAEIKSKEEKLTATNKKHIEFATKGINAGDVVKQKKETQSIKDQITKLKERKEKIHNVFFGIPSEATTKSEGNPEEQKSMGTPATPSSPSPQPSVSSSLHQETSEDAPPPFPKRDLVHTPTTPTPSQNAQNLETPTPKPPLPARPLLPTTPRPNASSTAPGVKSAPPRPERNKKEELPSSSPAASSASVAPSLPPSGVQIPPPLASVAPAPSSNPPPPKGAGAPPPPPFLPPPPAAAEPRTPSNTSGRGALLSQIQQGTTLNPADPKASKADRPQKHNQEKSLATVLADAMTARRGGIAGPEDTKENDKENDDWN